MEACDWGEEVERESFLLFWKREIGKGKKERGKKLFLFFFFLLLSSVPFISIISHEFDKLSPSREIGRWESKSDH